MGERRGIWSGKLCLTAYHQHQLANFVIPASATPAKRESKACRVRRNDDDERIECSSLPSNHHPRQRTNIHPSLRRKRHRRGADFELDDGDVQVAGGEEVADGFEAHACNEFVMNLRLGLGEILHAIQTFVVCVLCPEGGLEL